MNKNEQVGIGDVISFGHYNQNGESGTGAAPIAWQVLDIKKEGGLFRKKISALIISQYGLDAKQYNDMYTDVTWNICTLRQWLNEDFYRTAFNDEERGRIIQVTNSNPNNPKFGTLGGKPTSDYVFLLSLNEIKAYFQTNTARQCKASAYARANGVSTDENGMSWWWLRTPGVKLIGAVYVRSSGEIDLNGYSVNYNGYECSWGMVRPALWIRF